MGPELIWPLAIVALALLFVPPLSFWGGSYFGEAATKGELLVALRELEEQRAENKELRQQIKEVQEAAVEAVKRAGHATKDAKELGAALADADDDRAFDRVLRIAGDGSGPAAAAPSAPGAPA